MQHMLPDSGVCPIKGATSSIFSPLMQPLTRRSVLITFHYDKYLPNDCDERGHKLNTMSTR